MRRIRRRKFAFLDDFFADLADDAVAGQALPRAVRQDDAHLAQPRGLLDHLGLGLFDLLGDLRVDLLQSRQQRRRVGGAEIVAAARLGDALQLRLVRVRHGKTHDVHDELDAGGFQRLDRRARIAAAGLLAVAHEHERGFRGAPFQQLGHLSRRRRNGRHSLRLHGGDARQHGGAVIGAGRDEDFDVGAVVFAAMAIGRQAELHFRRDGRHYLGQDGLGRRHLGPPPRVFRHAARRVEDEHRLRQRRRERGQGNEQENQSDFQRFHLVAPRRPGAAPAGARWAIPMLPKPRRKSTANPV